MATRLRKTRKNRGSRYCGWGQVGQHRASGHKGGLGVSGQLKHHYSSMLRDDPDHFGHGSMHPPSPNVTKRWAGVRDLDDLYERYGAEEGGKKTIDLGKHGFDKLLGGGAVSQAYVVKVPGATSSAVEKVAKAGGQVLADQKAGQEEGQEKQEAQTDNG